jgi:uncharacterized membrane protein required for colicin V production
MYPLTVTGVIIIAVVVLACIGGWATSGTTRLARELGFVLGLLAGLVVALRWVPYIGGRPAAVVLFLGATLGGGLLGAAALGGVGHAIARGLHRIELGPLDRLLGAALSGVGAVALCALALHALILIDPSSALTRAARHDMVAQLLIHNRAVMWL